MLIDKLLDFDFAWLIVTHLSVLIFVEVHANFSFSTEISFFCLVHDEFWFSY